MTLFLVTFAVFALAVAGMSIGVILSNRCIQGSCGGLGSLRDGEGNPMCEGCTSPSEDCETKAAAAPTD